MKKKLESEIMSIAHKILKLKGKENVLEMHSVVGELYEKLSVLKFAHENFDETISSIGNDSSFFNMLDAAFNNKISDNIEFEDKIYVNMDEVEAEEIMEPVIEKIKDMVKYMPPEPQNIKNTLEENAFKNDNEKDSFEELTKDFKKIPDFEPVDKRTEPFKQKPPLKDKLNKSFSIDLNDKLIFITHLFEGHNKDYERVLSQLNTFSSFEEASKFINNMVKPDYNNWENKKVYLTRFMEIIEAKFN